MNRFRFNMTVLPYAFLFFSSLNLFSQDLQHDYLPDAALFENYMQAAGRHDEHSQWLDYAESGFDSAMASWENEFLMFTDNADSEVLRLEAQQALNNIISDSYAEWLCERFFRDVPVPSISGLSAEIAVLNEQYLYDVKSDGSIRYKNAEGYEDTGSEKGEHSLWRDGASAKIAGMIARWNEQMTTAFSDLKASVSENRVIDALIEKYNRSLEFQREKYHNQLYRLYQTEQSRFVSIRLNDQYSLEQINEKETASNVTAEILTAVQDELDGGLAALKSCIEGRAENPGAVSADTESQSWRDQFQILLDKGLARWDSAEEQLLMERISWEQEAGRTAAEGEQIWADALAQLNAKRTEWMTEFRETLQEGSRLWALENEKLEDSIDRAVNEIDRNIADTGASLQNRIDNLIGIMLQSAEMMQTSESSWNYWMSCYASGSNKSFNSNQSGLNPQQMRTIMSDISPSLAGAASDPAWKEAEYWAGIFETYYSYAEDAHQKLSGTYGITVLDDASLTTAFDGMSLSESLTNVFMDEPQIELLKADAYMQYWQRQHDIAQTVYDYTADYSSSKETAAVTIDRLDTAKTAYDEIFSEYSDALERLNNIGSELDDIQLDLNLLRQETEMYQQQLSEVRDEYTRTIADLEADDLSYLSEEFRDSYERLIITSGLKADASAAPSTALENYLLAAAEYDYENQISLLSARIKELINGKDLPGSEAELNTGSLSFSELETRMRNAASAGFCVFADAGQSGFAMEGGGEEQLAAYLSDRLMLSMDDYRYDKLLEYFGLYRGADSRQKAVILWEMQRIAEDVRRGYKTDYELRLAELRLLSASDFNGWGEAYLGLSEPHDAVNESSPDGAEYIYNAIAEDLAVYRAVLELYEENKEDVFCIYDWQQLIGSNTIQLCPEQAYQLLWEYHRDGFNSDESAAWALNELVGSLEALSGWVVSLSDTAEPAAAFENALKNPEQTLGQQHLKTYLEGRHNLISYSGGLYSCVYSEKEAENRFRESVKEILRRNIDTAPALSEYSVERTKTAFADVLIRSGLYDEQSLSFIEPEDVWNKCGFSSIEDAADYIRNLEEDVSLLNMPGYMSERFAAYTDSLKSYFAVKAAEAEIDAAADVSEYDDLIKEKVQQLNNQSGLLIFLQDHDDSCLKLLEIAESADIPEVLRIEAERRYIETSAIKLAAAALEHLDKNVSPSDFLSAAEIDVYRDEIIRKAAEYYELADALASPESAAMGIQSAEFQRYYCSMLWNTLPFEDAFMMFNPEQAERIISDLEKARLISSLMPESASLFQSDLESEWLYNGNSVLREADEFINSAGPLVWASEDFNPAEEIQRRYIPEGLISTYRESLNLTDAESSAGMTFSDKASIFWESEFRVGAESGSFEGLLKAFAGLMLIDEAAENEHSSRNIIESLVDGLDIGSADADFLKTASNHASAAVTERLDLHMQVNNKLLSGEALYWNLTWNMRNDVLNDEFNINEARLYYIFNGDDSFRIIEDWIAEHQNSYAAFGAGIEELIDSILPDLTSLAADPFGGIYSDITAFNTGALLIETAGYEAEDAAELINWFLDERGITSELNADSLFEYTSEAYEERLDLILAEHPSAAVHYLKQRIAANDISANELDAVLQRLSGVSAGAKEQLRLDKTLQDDLLVYSPLIHGDFEEFLDLKYSDDEIKRHQREVYVRFRGSSGAQWDDEAFVPGLKDNTDAVRILQSIAANKTEAAEFFYTESGGRVSPNDIFINEVMTVLGRSLYGDESLLNTELGKILLLKDMLLKAGVYNDSITTPGADSWRSCLKQKYMPEQNDELELFQTADDDHANIILDAACCYSERSLQLGRAIEHWVLSDAELPVNFDQLNTALYAENMEYFSDPEIDELFNHTVSSELQNRYEENRLVFNNIEESVSTLKNAVRTTGNRFERLLEMSSMGSTQRAQELKPLIERISMLETMVESSGNKWQEALNGPEGYRALELEYAAECKRSEELFDALEDAKHQYAVAQVVYEYASSGYLRVNMESEQIPDSVRAVEPAERLAEAERKLKRAEAAYNVLENIVGNRKELPSMYEADPMYREYFDSYLESFKDTLVLNSINRVLNEAVAVQAEKTAGAFDEWREVLRDSYGRVNWAEDSSNGSIPDELNGCRLGKNDNGDWRLSWNAAETGSRTAEQEELFKAYFRGDSEAVYTMSPFEEDLMIWLQKADSIQDSSNSEAVFSTWAQALQWEDYLNGSDDRKKQLEDQISSALNISNDDSLDRVGAESVIKTTWEDAYNRVSGYSEEMKWMFDFYKLIQRAGIMQISINAAGGSSKENLEMLAREESIAAANRYMSEKYHENADAMIAASVPVFATAAFYWAAGVAALSVPVVGWVQAAILFAAAAAMTIGGTCLVGEGRAKHAAAYDIQSRIVSPAEKNIIRFISDFKRDTDGILRKRDGYQTESARLESMTGLSSGPEGVTDQQRVEQLRISVIQSFTKQGESIHDLLVSAELADENAQESGDAEILDSLFGRYFINADSGGESMNNINLLTALKNRAFSSKAADLNELNNYLSVSGRTEAEQNYKDIYELYVEGDAEAEDLLQAADEAWGTGGISVREHLPRLYEEQEALAAMLFEGGQSGTELYADLLLSQKTLLTGDGQTPGLYAYRMKGLRDVKIHELDLLRLDAAEKRKNWEEQMLAIAAVGEFEWRRAENRFNNQFHDWTKKAESIFARQRADWDYKYSTFLDDKMQWLDSVAVQSTKTGDSEVLKNFGRMTKASVTAAGTELLIPDFQIETPEPEEIIGGIVDINLINELLARSGDFLIKGPDIIRTVSTASLKGFNAADDLEDVRQFQELNNDEFRKHLAELDFQQTLEQIKKAEDLLRNSIDDANDSIESDIHRMMRNDGYTRKGSYYHRRLVTGSTLYEPYVYDDGYVSTYEDFDPGEIDFSSDLNYVKNQAGSLDSVGLRGLVKEALNNIKGFMGRIFGEDLESSREMITDLGLSAVYDEEKGSYTVSRTDISIDEEPGWLEGLLNRLPGFSSSTETAGSAESGDAAESASAVELSPGLFGIHIGYAPEFSRNADISRGWDEEGQLRFKGLGEMGRIMGEFIFNRMIEANGWVEINTPHYRKRLWDDSDSWIKAPSMADAVGMALNLCTLGAGGGLSALTVAAVNLSDDLVLSAFDIGGGEKTLLEGAVDFGETAAISLLGAGNSELFASIDTEGMNLGERILLSGSEQLLNNTAVSAVNALSYAEGAGWHYSLNVLQQGIFGEDTVAGLVGTAAGMWAGSGLTNLAGSSWSPVETAFYGSAIGLGSIAAAQAGEFAVHAADQFAVDGFSDTGGSLLRAFDDMELSLNLVDAGSLLDMSRLALTAVTDNYSDSFMRGWNTAADNLRGSSLFALNLNSSGVTGSVTGSGINLGSDLYKLTKGLALDIGTRVYDRQHDDAGASTMRKGYAAGDQSFEDTVWRLLSGKDSLYFDSAARKAQTMKNNGGGRDIHLDSAYRYASEAEQLKSAAALQHEAHRDGVYDIYNGEETFRAVEAHTEMVLGLGRAYGFDFISGDENLTADIAAYMYALRGTGEFDQQVFSDYVDGYYDSTADYWKLMNDGKIVWDGEKDLRNEAGEVVRIDKTGSFSKSLLNWIGKDNAIKLLSDRGVYSEGLSESEMAYKLMGSSGVEWVEDAYSSTTGANTGAYLPSMGLDSARTDADVMKELLSFQLSESEAFHLGKISQESPDIAYYAGNDEKLINVMAATGCYYLATLGAVQTQAGVLLSADQINKITQLSLANGWLANDDYSIWSTGAAARENISRIAFAELGIPAVLDFTEPSMIDGLLGVGKTVNGNNHASEYGSNREQLFDSYQGINYNSENIFILYPYEFVNEYSNYYWRKYEELYN